MSDDKKEEITLVHSVSRTLEMPECGDVIVWRGKLKFVVMQLDFRDPKNTTMTLYRLDK